ncbi:nucleoside hydrolase-like domain-containing protein [Nonomuraea sp. JJY05]|uniref:DUF1593 domain-containing protein n=1 Tax=Nonomuraea sp. JJY05 TaxID=3350255 RepID=UPI00373EA866
MASHWVRNSVGTFLLLSLAAGMTASPAEAVTRSPRPRTIVTADPELDDANSLIRYLLYSNEVTTEGLIYASSRFHWKGDGKGTEFFLPGREYTTPQTSWRWAQDEQFIHTAVKAYAEVYPNLVRHDRRYPDPRSLYSKIRVGNVEFEGDISEETPGSNLIKDVLLDGKGGPVYLQAWGGTSTIARALKSIQEQYEGTPRWERVRREVSRKAIITKFGSQDATYQDYIAPNWPDIEARDVATTIWGYFARRTVLPEHAQYLSARWTAENVSGNGPFGALYRIWGDGKQMVEGDVWDHFGLSYLGEDELRTRGYKIWMPIQEKGSWISEGDTSNFMNLVDNGLRAYEQGNYGGWGGRQEQNPDDPSEWLAAKAVDRDPQGNAPADYAAARWFEAAQLDFAARLRWSVTPDFRDANHRPEITLPAGRRDLTARPGQKVHLSARATDPDGDKLSSRWWQYQEAGSYQGAVEITTDGDTATAAPGRHSSRASFTVPADARPGSTIHVIVEVKDDGSPALTAYQRIIVTVR